MAERDHREESVDNIEPGMQVEATKGDLGEDDVSPARVEDVRRDESGNIKKVVVRKGALFHKEIEVPADRIQEVEQDREANSSQGEVKIDVSEREIESLQTGSIQSLAHREEAEQCGLLDQVEQQVPTAEGLREKEGRIYSPRPRNPFWRIVGPGFLAGMSGNDSSAITTYAINGASLGYGLLWLMLLSTPLYFAVQFACAKIGRVSRKGLSQLLCEQYGRGASTIVSILLIITNVSLIAADLAAVGSGFSLITGLNWIWFLVPVAVILWYLTVYRNFESLKKIFLVLSFAFVCYIITSIIAHPDWSTVLAATFVPHMNWTFTGISNIVALLGATISPYSMFWQVQGEREEVRDGRDVRQQVRQAGLDVASGVVSGNLVAYFVIVGTATTLFPHHIQINTAQAAAQSLEPLLGPFARYLFALGLIGSGVVAIPVLLASTSYAVSGTFGWPAGLSKQPWQNEGFYLTLTAALVVGLLLALIGISPITLIFGSNIVAGVLAPILVIIVFLIGNDRRVMKKHRLGRFINLCLIVISCILIVAAIVFFYSLVTGQGS